MKAILISFLKFLRGVLDDFMLIACILMPLIMGAAFRFGIPALEKYLCSAFSKQSVLEPYYLIFDLTIAVMTPMMFSFTGVMTVLEELDNGTARYLMVTPIGKSGYLASRVGITAAVSAVYSVIAVALFGIADMSVLMNVAVSVMCSVTGVIVSVFVVALAGNKVEGMALIKLSGIIILGIPAVFFLPAPIKYAACIFPSYWFTEMARSGNYLYALPSLLVSSSWFAPIYVKFSRKLI